MLINSMTSVHKGQDLLELLLKSMKETVLCQEEWVAEKNPLSFQEKSSQFLFFFLQVESDICDLKKGLVFCQFVLCEQPETNLILSGLADSRTFNV